MATSKRKSASPAKKKATVKAGTAKKPAPKKAAPVKKPVKATKKAAPKKAVSAKKPPAKAVVKSQRPVKKLVAAKKPAPKKPVAKPSRPAKPAPKPVAKKPAPQKQAVSTKDNMSAVATTTPDTVTREDGRYALPSTVNIELPPNYRPTAKEEYMGPRQLAYFRAKLLKWREDLVEESKQTIDNLRDEVRDVGDEAERATRETENSLELRTRDRYRKLIGKIDKALKRIEEGRYGYCEETDEEIGIERLEARPIATLSLDAQERWEHRQKQMGD